MKKLAKTLAVLSVLALASCTQKTSKTSNAPGAVDKDVAVENSFMVMGDAQVIESHMASLGVASRVETTSSSLNIHHVTYQGKTSYQKIASGLAPKVELIEQDSKVELSAIEKKFDWPEDKYFFYQWALNNIGQSAPWGLPGQYDADIKLLQALEKYKGQIKEDTIVAVIDSGVNYKHEDINANMWVNEKEAQKSNGIAGQDDDGNGYCDDVHGYDFTSGGRMAPHCGKIGDPDPMDEDTHGTHCAGSIAAVGNNQVGISGINPKAKIMALRALGGAGGTTSDIIKATIYAMENGANVISASFGGKAESEIMKKTIEAAGKKGVLFVVAAGNNGQSMELEGNRTYPASYQLPNIITVAASDNMDNSAVFTNYGANFVDVYAPGVGILSLAKGNGYTIMDGTSMAAPIVSGLASLILSVYPELKNNPVRVKEIIMATVDEKAAFYGKVRSNGRINALAALDQAKSAIKKAPITWQQQSESISQLGYNTELVDIRHTIKKEGAKAIRVHFDFVELDRSFDSVYIYDKNFKLIHEVLQGSSRDMWSPVIKGDQVILRFVNAKVKKQQGPMPVQMKANEMQSCLKKGGTIQGPVTPEDPTQKASGIVCLQDNMEYRYEDLQKEADDSDVFFSWKSEGFSVDKIEYTENEI